MNRTSVTSRESTSKMRPSAVLEERSSSAGEDNQSGGTTRIKPETDLSSPLFSASQYLAVTHGVRASHDLILC